MALDDVLVALDIEATGMEPSRDRIIEVGAVKFRGETVLDRYESLVRPEREVSYSIENLTGLSNEELKEAPRIRTVSAELRAFISNHPIVGQSIAFDLAMLEAAGISFRNRAFDTFELATILLPDLPTYDLGTIARRLEIDIDNKHRAVADAATTQLVFNRLVDKIHDFDSETLSRMVELTRQSRSPLSYVFQSVARQKRRESESYGGNTIGAQLMAQLGGNESISPEAMFLVSRDRPERLEDTGSAEPVSDKELAYALAPDGPFSQCIPNYEPRDQQLDMAQAVGRTLSQGGQLLLEAGTGTGKSLGYLLPAALLAMERGEPVVISTATIALQDQLLNKDIPALVEAGTIAAKDLPDSRLAKLKDLRASVLKGRANYLCLRRWFLAQREPVGDTVEAELHAKITAWLQHTDTGDRAELRLSPDQQQRWMRLSEDEGACVPSQCVFHRRNQCFLFRARHDAEASHLIVVNHSLLLSDLMRGGSVLPRFGHLIIDEAQHLEGEVTRQASFSVSQRRVQTITDRVLDESDPSAAGGVLGLAFRTLSGIESSEVREATRAIQSAIDSVRPILGSMRQEFERVFASLQEFMVNQDVPSGGHEQRLRLTNGLRNDPSWTQIEIEWDSTAETLDSIVRELSNVRAALQPIDDEALPSISEITTELELVENELKTVRHDLYATLSEAENNLIVWLTRMQNSGEIAVNAAPLHVADLLHDELYPRLESLTLTSATLSTEGTFSFIRERLGLEDAEGVQVPSPFDYERSTLVAIADDVPDPNQPGHQKAIQQALIELCRASRGRAMVLFTSHNALQNSYYAIKRELEAEGILVLGQRVDGSPRQLLERLGEHPETVLLGTNSFWEGVDIVGDALSLLIITRLPFSVPSDPIFAARSDLYENSFIEYAVPQAILRFKQGFGRLIRSSNDRGVVVVLDRRVISRRYGEAFLTSLPETEVDVSPVSRISNRVEEWLARALQNSSARKS